MIRVAVTGVGGGVGQAILRALSRSTLELDVIGLDADPTADGLYACARGYLLPRAEDPAYGDRLLEILAAERTDALIPGSDPELAAVAALRGRLARAGVRAIAAGAEAIALCRDKLKAYRFFDEAGFPFVRTVPAGEAGALAASVGFPLLVKPVDGSASRGVNVVFDANELRKYAQRPGWIAQPYLVPASLGKARAELSVDDVMQDGHLRQDEEFSVQVVFDHEGHVLGRFTSCNVLKSGVPTFVDPRPGGEVERHALEMAELLASKGLTGPCNFQGKRTEDGPVFFEVNPRFTGITAVRAAMGFNEVEAVLRRCLLNAPLEAVRDGLRVAGDWVSTRYVDERLVPRDEFNRLVRDGGVVRKEHNACLQPRSQGEEAR